MSNPLNTIFAFAGILTVMVGAAANGLAQSNEKQTANGEQAEQSGAAGDTATEAAGTRQNGSLAIGPGEAVTDPTTDPIERAERLRQSECMEDLIDARAEYTGDAATAWGINYRLLARAAQEFAVHGQEEACEEVVEGMEELKEQRQEMAEEDREREAERRMEAAVATTDLQGGVRASEVIGVMVRNTENESLGEIDDVILNSKDGTIRYVLASEGGFLGIGEDWVAVPWHRLKMSRDMLYAYLPISEEAFEDAPKVTEDQINSIPNKEWSEQVKNYYDSAIKNQP